MDTIAHTKYNPRAERDELIRFVSTLSHAALTSLHLRLEDDTYAAALDYLDPDMVHFFIGNPATRRALLAGCIAHITAMIQEPAPANPYNRILAATPAGTELQRTPEGNLILIEHQGKSQTHYAATHEAQAWHAFTNQATFEATGCPF